MNNLQIQYDVTDERLTIRPFIDGHDLLAEYRNDQGRDPDDLLPPLSSLLQPTSAGRLSIIGVCSCGETGCGSLTLVIRRVGSEVIWEPAERAKYETLTRRYEFDLVPYLNAIDSAVSDPPAGEGEGRRVARAVRLALAQYDEQFGTVRIFHGATIDWISAWPWTSGTVKASLTTSAGQTIHEFNSQLGESESAFAARTASELNRLRLEAR